MDWPLPKMRYGAYALVVFMFSVNRSFIKVISFDEIAERL